MDRRFRGDYVGPYDQVRWEVYQGGGDGEEEEGVKEPHLEVPVEGYRNYHQPGREDRYHARYEDDAGEGKGPGYAEGVKDNRGDQAADDGGVDGTDEYAAQDAVDSGAVLLVDRYVLRGEDRHDPPRQPSSVHEEEVADVYRGYEVEACENYRHAVGEDRKAREDPCQYLYQRLQASRQVFVDRRRYIVDCGKYIVVFVRNLNVSEEDSDPSNYLSLVLHNPVELGDHLDPAEAQDERDWEYYGGGRDY